ncbi:ABC transporter ATP-binding protein arb1 [Coemansia thaxteri]|uniref:ABC transporter ATP-binding protein arb1 n=1 Tax=Coemansia thaxteri TaxID=2663907 RepID=A0A9W8EKC6_9FUNG|nr:ABC transporter ATP-binding protein arb1 [Coemansia thaxteri]KAJ2008332.1 ABC transporter ATP-binding protein arb1 [Coemansia thaxteri]KAJ2472158.1 ABC transporter ATP-binding protein arb1 [Coemansia sp. RSA 2322]KAJ2487736.1 ABC transporter ATP-binding protein arb1 [Coemansia sp. RSA 2320]
MVVSASKQKRLAAKAAKGTASAAGSAPGSGASTPARGIEKSMSELKLEAQRATDRSATGVLTSNVMGRDIHIDSYTLSFHGRMLIESAKVELNYGNRYGLLGDNGCGKSTFLRSIAEGDIELPPHMDTYLLSEEAEPTDLDPVEYVVKAARDEFARLERELEDILSGDDGADNPLLDGIYERMDQMDANTFEPRAAELLHGLGFDKERMKLPTKSLSGGWRMRVALAQCLFKRPTVLLLDDPTNHLDLQSVVYLEEYLKTYTRILLIVSHSQDFLNSVCSHTIHITPKRRLVYYGGNYDTFVRTKHENEVNQAKAYDKQQEEIAHIKKFIASAGTYSNLVRQAKSKQKIIDKMEAAGLIEKVEVDRKIKFRFPDTTRLPPPVLSFDDVTFSYDGVVSHALYRNVDAAVDMDSRIALIGPNGTGKSTLLKLMSGDLDPTEGRVQRHTQLKLAKYSQHSNDQLDGDKSPIDYIRHKFPQISQDTDFWRQQLGRFGLSGNHQTNAINTLSDGLKSRLVFAEIAQEAPGIILFDEPTNGLAPEAIDGLADAINHFNGGVVLVSHDFRLISQVAKELWLCEDKQITRFTGSIEKYKENLRKQVHI